MKKTNNTKLQKQNMIVSEGHRVVEEEKYRLAQRSVEIELFKKQQGNVKD